jgi:hypothetical protein
VAGFQRNLMDTFEALRDPFPLVTAGPEASDNFC